MRVVMIVAGAILSGCAPGPAKVMGPSGNEAFVVSCTASHQTMAACYRQATELCPSGYSVVSEEITGKGRRVGGIMTIECP